MMRDLKWSKTGKQIAKKAFEKAYEQECSDLAEKIRSRAEKIKEPADIWHLKDFVNKRVREIGNSMITDIRFLFLVFAGLIKDRWLNFEDLRGLSQEKIDLINALLNL